MEKVRNTNILLFELSFDKQLLIHKGTKTNRLTEQFNSENPRKNKTMINYWVLATITVEIYIYLVLMVKGTVIKPDMSL